MTEKRFVPIGVEWTDGFIQDHEDDKDLFSANAVCDLLNELSEENEQLKQQNKELKSDNDIKFWKLQYIRFSNGNGIILHEISRAIEEGYEVSEEFQKYLNELKVQNDENKEKMGRLGI